MVLDELHELIETLQARIDEHESALQQSEALTRYALIDPLLRGLGWDTGDPSQVLVEYRSSAGSADYALLGQSNKPQVIVEAKKLGTQLDFRVRQQVTGYCQEEGIPYAVITDGQHWELYDVFKPVAMKDSIVTSLNIKDVPAPTALKALALWQPSAVAGGVSPGMTQVVDTDLPVPEADQPTHKAPMPPHDQGWHRLSEFKPTAGTTPSAVRLPDNTTGSTKGWGDFVAEIGRWLYEKGHLTESLLPIQRSRNSYIVAKAPVNPTGKNFSASKMIGPFYTSVNLSSTTLVRDAKFMIEKTGQNPDDFAVRLQ